MKFIKAYESYNGVVEIGKYYLIYFENDFYKGKFINIKTVQTNFNRAIYEFEILIDNLDKYFFHTTRISKNYIERELTQTEIEEYDMKKTANKYNIG